MDDRKTIYTSYLLLLAPVIFVFHFLEESPGFVQWFNKHVARGITTELFWTVNISALVITFIVVGIYWFSRSSFSLALAIGWFSCLMLANAIFHIVGGVVDRQHVPGLATAIVVAVLGSLPMLIHGYLILFRGSRLF